MKNKIFILIYIIVICFCIDVFLEEKKTLETKIDGIKANINKNYAEALPFKKIDTEKRINFFVQNKLLEPGTYIVGESDELLPGTYYVRNDDYNNDAIFFINDVKYELGSKLSDGLKATEMSIEFKLNDKVVVKNGIALKATNFIDYYKEQDEK